MCGIVGYTGKADQGLIRQMNRMLTHRGPDDEGYYSDTHVSLAMRRLSIIDLAGGHQPISNEDHSIWVVLNGEIYNYTQLRAELAARGHLFRTNSDTETLVHAYEEYGIDFLSHLRGMFAIALWDKTKRKLIIARDRIGEKPLFYARDGEDLVFGSEIKAILPRLKSWQLNQRAIEPFLTCGYLPGDATFFEEVKKVEPAHAIIWQDGKTSFFQYWDVNDYIGQNSTETSQTVEELDLILNDAVTHCLKSDVEVGAFLSGGLDSSLLCALVAKRGANLKTFSIGYGGRAKGFNELQFAAQVAGLLRTDHHEIVVDPSDSISLLPRILSHYDEPHGEPTSILVHTLCQFAAKEVKVALGGTGADELFYGYPRHKGPAYLQNYRRIPLPLRDALIRPLLLALPESTSGSRVAKRLKRFVRDLSGDPAAVDMYRNWASLFSAEDSHLLLSEDIRAKSLRSVGDRFIKETLGSPATYRDLMNRVAALDVGGYLPEYQLAYMDRMSMANSLEVRSPFCDYKLAEHVLSLPPELRLRRGTSKWMLKKLAQKYIPHEIIYRKKVGFDSPIGQWLKHELSGFLTSFLAESELKRSGLLHPPTVAKIIHEHRSGRRDYSLHLWSIIALECWYRMYFENSTIGKPDIVINDIRGAAPA